MKKTVIALAAAAAASGAFAQVVLSGNLDIAGVSSTGTIANANGTTFQSSLGTSSTSAINISATEDMGGGMKAFAFFGLDPRSFSNDSMSFSSASNTGPSASASAIVSTITGLGRHEVYVGLSGGFGQVSLGSRNAPSLDVNAASSPLGTGIGSGYTGNNTSATMWNAGMSTRYSRSVKYESPVINGFQLNVAYAPGNDQSNATAGTGILSIPNGRQATDLSLKYSSGNLNLAVAYIAQGAQTNGAGSGLTYFGQGTTNMAATQTTGIGANYKFGNITAYVGGITGNGLTGQSTARNISASRFGVKANMGQVDLMAQYTEVSQNNSGSASTVAKVTGARVDYNLSKTAAAYLGYEMYDTGATSANQQTITSIGIRKSF